jgi:PAS domain S-box-containing protein
VDRQFARAEVPRLLRLTALSGVIIHLDEVLTMSARMAATTGDSAWETRYHEYEPKLDDAIREARGLAEVLKNEDVTATDAANAKLVEMEERAFALVRDGRKEDARSILFGSDYEEQKSIYARGMSRLKARLKLDVDRAMTDVGDRLLAQTIVIILLAPLLIVTSFLSLRRVGQWRAAMIDLNARVVERTEKLTQSEERFRQLVEHVDGVFWMQNLDRSRVIYVSPAYETIWGRTCESLIADPGSWTRAIPEDSRADFDARIGKASAGEGVVAEYPIDRPDGTRRWIKERVFPIRDAEGRVYRIGGVAEDITDARTAED